MTYLEERVKYFDDAYRSGNALISDAQFDKLEANLYRVNPQSDYFSNKKALPLPSLPKDRVEEFIEDLFELNFTKRDFVHEPGEFSSRGNILDILSFSNI